MTVSINIKFSLRFLGDDAVSVEVDTDLQGRDSNPFEQAIARIMAVRTTDDINVLSEHPRLSRWYGVALSERDSSDGPSEISDDSIELVRSLFDLVLSIPDSVSNEIGPDTR